MNERTLREQLVMLGHSLYARGLSAGSSGNISVRLDDGWLLTPTNTSLGHLDPARLSRLDAAGRLLEGDPPSKEAFLHRSFYAARPGTGAVVHLHSTHAVAVSCLDGLGPEAPLPPLTAYYVMRVGSLALVPYHRPGDPALADAVAALAPKHTAVLLANHGPVVAGRTLERAVYAIEELEETARLHLLLRGLPVRPLTPDQIEELHRHFPPE